MPKTRTTDVAPPFPTPVEGPLTVVDPADSESWLTIDPANAELSAAGNARPTRVVFSRWTRTYFTTSAHFVSGIVLARLVNANTVGGFYATDVRIPDDMDVTATSDLKFMVAPAFSATTNGQSIQFSITHTRLRVGIVQLTVITTMDWPVPNNWTVSDQTLVTMDNGNGRTFEANTFQAGDILGLRIVRAGTDEADTFNKGVKIGELMQFVYTAKSLT